MKIVNNMLLEDQSIDFIKGICGDAEKILSDNKYRELKNFPRHKYTNTYDHSIRVAVGAALIARVLGADEESAVRVGLLHDMCFVNYYERNDHKGLFCFYHPVEAADNAHDEFGINDREMKDIRAHMFPLGWHVPSSKVALALTLSDKAVAMYEGLYGIHMFRYMLAKMYNKSMEPVVLRAVCR